MKVTPEHRQQIEDGIAALFAKMHADSGITEEEVRDRYRRREIPRGDAVQDIDKRFRWDLYWGASRVMGSMPDSTNGYNDAHIDTALRAVVKPL